MNCLINTSKKTRGQKCLQCEHEHYLELQRVEDEIADDVVLPLEQERDARGHQVPDEHLVVGPVWLGG